MEKKTKEKEPMREGDKRFLKSAAITLSICLCLLVSAHLWNYFHS